MTEQANNQTNGGFKPFQLIDEQVREVVQLLESRGKTLEKEWQRLQGDLDKRTKGVRKDLEKRTKTVRKDLEKRAKGVQRDLEKRTKGVRKDLEKRTKVMRKDLNKRRDVAYHLAGLATKAEVDALNRRLRQLNKSVTTPQG